MNVKVMNECGYNESAVGFSLSWNSTDKRAKELFPTFAFKGGGENKFLESIHLWLLVTAPRFWWQEFDTYRVGVSKQSESTMHTISKRLLTQDDFEYDLPKSILEGLNEIISLYKDATNPMSKKALFHSIKNALPEGFLQMREVSMSYKNLQNMYEQRINHRLIQWQEFLTSVLAQIEHPEFITREEK